MAMAPRAFPAETEVSTVRRSFARRESRPVEVAVRLFFAACAVIVVVATALMIAFLARAGITGIGEVGLGSLLTGRIWKPEADVFGGLPLIVGTVVSALGALVAGAAPAVLSAVWVHELSHKKSRRVYRRIMELAAAVPSVVYGWLALTYLVPYVHSFAQLIYGEDAHVGGEGLASAAMLLGVMIAPTVHLLSLDALSKIPDDLRLASAALGASPLQTSFRVAVPSAWRGIIVAVFFGFARAAGETMAVQMVIGGARKLPENLFQPTTTISAQVVMDMQNARPGTTSSNVLFSMSLVLLLVSVGVVLVTRFMTRTGSGVKRKRTA